jgi:hypothetical protein
MILFPASARRRFYDEHSVPRYCTFEPRRSASIHIGEIALAEITCQACQQRFHVALSPVNFQERTIAEAIQNKTLHYGDPPRHGCGTGDFMNSEPRRVLEYWRRHDQRHVVDGNRIMVWRSTFSPNGSKAGEKDSRSSASNRRAGLSPNSKLRKITPPPASPAPC